MNEQNNTNKISVFRKLANRVNSTVDESKLSYIREQAVALFTDVKLSLLDFRKLDAMIAKRLEIKENEKGK